MTKKKPTEPKANKILPLPEVPESEDQLLNTALQLGTQGMTLKRVTCITELLADQDSLVQIAESAALGASIGTIEMQLGLPDGMLKGWLNNGKADSEGPFHVFYRFYITACAEAKLAAESSLLRKSPAAWLERCDVLAQLNPQKQEEPEPTNTVQSHVTYKEFSLPKEKDNDQKSE